MTPIKDTRGEFLYQWVQNALSYGEIKINVQVNDDSDKDRTAFEVKLSSETNSKTSTIIMEVLDEADSHYVQILWGEDFESCDHETFLRYVLVDTFITHTEF